MTRQARGAAPTVADTFRGRTPNSHIRRGRAGLVQAQHEREEQQRRREGRGPFRFYLKEGEQAEVVVLDNSLEDCVFLYEHSIPGPGMNWRETENVICARDFGHCTPCEKVGSDDRFRRPYYALFMSVFDTREFTIQRGDRQGQRVQGSRKLLVVKSTQINDFARLEEACRQRHQTMRGMILLLERERGQQTARTGKPILMDNGSLFDWIPENEIVSDYGHDPVIEEGKVIKQADQDITPFDYDRIFPAPDPQELARRYGGTMPAGANGSGNGVWDEEEAGAPQGRASRQPRTGRRSRAATAPLAQGARRTRRRVADTTAAPGSHDPDDIPF